jgi:uncharacterized protein
VTSSPSDALRHLRLPTSTWSEWKGPIPARNPETESFWEGLTQHEILLQRCPNCRTWVHRPLSHCPGCFHSPLLPVRVDGHGSVYSFSIVMREFSPGVPPPYAVALIQLEEPAEVRLLSNIVNCDAGAIEVGMRVSPLFRDVDEDTTLLYYEPSGGT